MFIFAVIALVLLSVAIGEVATVSTFLNKPNPFNITFNESDTVKSILRLPLAAYITNLTLELNGINVSSIPGQAPLMCLQEYFNQTSYCSFSKNKEIYINDVVNIWDPANATDGNYTTKAKHRRGVLKRFYINYTKPFGFINLTWQVKDQHSLRNTSPPAECYNFYPDKVALVVELSDTFIKWKCVYGGGLREISARIDTPSFFFEEAVFWNISNMTNYPSDTIVEIGDRDNKHEWNFSGQLVGKHQANINTTFINNLLAAGCVCDNCSIAGAFCDIPFYFSSERPSTLLVNLTNATYESHIGACFLPQYNHTILNMSYFDEVTEAAITSINNYDLFITDGEFTHTVQGNFSGKISDSICSDINPAERTFDFEILGDITVKKDEYGTKLLSFAAGDPITATNANPYRLNITLIRLNESSTVVFTWLTSGYEPIDGTMKIYECEGDGTRTFLDSSPITNGEANVNLVLINKVYSYEVVYLGETYTDSKSYTQCHVESQTERRYIINTGTNIAPITGLYSIDCNLTKLTDNSFRMEWETNPESTETLIGCAYTNRITVAGNTLVDVSCANITTFLQRTIAASGYSYHVFGKIFQGGYSKQCKDQLEYAPETRGADTLGLMGIFAVYFLIVGMILLFSNESPIWYPIMGGVGLLISFILGIIAIGWIASSSMLFLVILIIFVGRYHKKE